ncbi:unnamed protein product [Phaedon cochleariae]|uniref:Elongation of very long chain fatty acids protein n=1 Tax=Phaedon cochleariae TaxID=80249 RepID=A0A9N9SF91_PHACE|nr:unnamed protein product [Phaedon cochleariae]
MALLLKRIYKGSFWLLNDLSDERTKNTWLASPTTVVAILGIYLSIVLHLGPKLMAHRKPYNLRTLMIVYNLVQIYLNLKLVYDALIHFLGDQNFNLLCWPVDTSKTPRAMKTTEIVSYFFILKMIDLLDTVIFVLRKSYKQISFLHLYHHAGMIMATWITYRYLPGGHSVFVGLVNCPVHAIMFAYYLGTIIDNKWGRSVIFKRSLTQLQLAQFTFFVFVYGAVVLNPACTFPKIPTYLFLCQNIFITLLFADFYRKTYVGQKYDNKLKLEKESR